MPDIVKFIGDVWEFIVTMARGGVAILILIAFFKAVFGLWGNVGNRVRIVYPIGMRDDDKRD